jgi:hypothetical protein
MTTLREALKLALDALGKWSSGRDMDAVELNDLIATLEAALEQPEQEPVASIYVTIGGDREFDDWRCPLPVGRNLLYTHPLRREWRGLTDEEMRWVMRDGEGRSALALARAIEAALKERNA